MRIKSPRLYDNIRTRRLLPLPSKDTLRRYTKNLRPAYGFQEATFELLQKKALELDIADTHGKLLSIF
jgi:hypothetical protein